MLEGWIKMCLNYSWFQLGLSKSPLNLADGMAINLNGRVSVLHTEGRGSSPLLPKFC